MVRLDPNQAPQMLQVVKRIQSIVTEKFRSDHRDVSILVRVLDFLLNFGKLLRLKFWFGKVLSFIAVDTDYHKRVETMWKGKVPKCR